MESQQIGTCPKCSRSSPPENNTPTSASHSLSSTSTSTSTSPEPQFLPTRNKPAFTTSKFPTRQESCTTGGIFLKIKIKKSKTQNKTHLPQQQKKKTKNILKKIPQHSDLMGTYKNEPQNKPIFLCVRECVCSSAPPT